MKFKIMGFLILIAFTTSSICYADFYKYRKNGGEVVGVSVSPNNLPIESEFSEIEGESGLDLSVKRIVVGSILREATAQEIAGFQAFEDEDNLNKLRGRAKLQFDSENRELMALKAVVFETVSEINILRDWLVAFKAEVALASNLADLKTRVASLSNTPPRTQAQVITALKNRITAGETD